MTFQLRTLKPTLVTSFFGSPRMCPLLTLHTGTVLWFMVYGKIERITEMIVYFYDNVFGKPFEQLSEGCYVRFKLLMSLKFVKNQGREWQCNAGSCVLVHNILVCTLLFCCRSFQNSFKKCCHITEEGWVCNGDYCFWTNYYIYTYTLAHAHVHVYIKENDVRWMDLRTVRWGCSIENLTLQQLHYFWQ